MTSKKNEILKDIFATRSDTLLTIDIECNYIYGIRVDTSTGDQIVIPGEIVLANIDDGSVEPVGAPSLACCTNHT